MQKFISFFLSVKEEKDKVEVVFNGSIDKGKYVKEKEEENERSLPRLNPGYMFYNVYENRFWMQPQNLPPKMST